MISRPDLSSGLAPRLVDDLFFLAFSGSSIPLFMVGGALPGASGFLHWLDKKRKAEEASLKSHCEKRRERLTLPKKMRQVLRCFEEVLSERVWEWAKVLVIGAILAKGRTNGDRDLARDGLAE